MLTFSGSLRPLTSTLSLKSRRCIVLRSSLRIVKVNGAGGMYSLLKSATRFALSVNTSLLPLKNNPAIITSGIAR